MLAEDQLIPYQESPLPPGPWLVFAPHPDDEVFGMGGAIARATEAGTVVEVVLITSGDQAGDPAIRRRESEAAAELLGVDRLYCWDIPDRQLDSAPLPTPKLLQLLETLRPRTVFVPGLQEYHPDHRSASLRLPPLLHAAGYTGGIWFYEISRHNEANRLVDITPVLERKQAAIRCFVSQLALNDYEGIVLAINRSRSYTLPAEITYAEAFREVEGREWSNLPAGLPARLAAVCRQNRPAAANIPRVLVSLIVRTRNRPGLLAEALASIANQTYDNIEVVVVNDGGCDVAEMVAAALVGRRFQVVDLADNRGRSAAANVGLAAAAGKYLGFLDDDDTLDPDHVLNLVTLQEATAEEIVVYAGVRGRRRNDPEQQEIARFAELEVNFAKLLLGNLIPIHAVLFPARLLASGARFDETLDLYEDWDFWLQLAELAPFVFANQVTANYYLGGVSGVSPLDFDVTTVKKATRLLFSKWLSRIAPDQFQAISDLYHQLKGLNVGLGQTIAEKDDQLALLNERMTERDGQLALLNERMTERDGQLALLNERITERDGQLALLNERITERDVQFALLNAKITERELQINDLARAVADRDTQISVVVAERSALLASNSWRITKPLRFVRQLVPKSFRWLWQKLPLSIQNKQRIKGVVFTRLPLLFRWSQAYKIWVNTTVPLPSQEFFLAGAVLSESQMQALIANGPCFDLLVRGTEEQRQITQASLKLQSYHGWVLLAEGDDAPPSDYWLALDAGDVLHPEALACFAHKIVSGQNLVLVYADEAWPDGYPVHKPGWNPDLLLASEYLGHLVAIHRSVAPRPTADEEFASYRWSACLAVETALAVCHIPHILLRRGNNHKITTEQACQVVTRALERRELVATVLPAGEQEGLVRVKWPLPKPPPRVSVIIPTRNGRTFLEPCLNSLHDKTLYPDWEILVVDNGSDDSATLKYLETLQEEGRAKVIRDPRPFNFSALNNYAVAQVGGEILAFLNDDVEVISADWLEEMVSQAIRPGVGAVGARLWYPDETLQHAGVVLGVGGVAGHAFTGLSRVETGYMDRAVLHQNWSAVTGACLVVARARFEEVGGFDEELAIAFNDIDLCLKLQSAGYRNVWTPYAELYHHESVSRGADHTSAEKLCRLAKEAAIMRTRWGGIIDADPAYNPNFSLSDGNCSLCAKTQAGFSSP